MAGYEAGREDPVTRDVNAGGIDVPSAYTPRVGGRGQHALMAQTAAGGQYSGAYWFSDDGERLFHLVSDVVGEEISGYLKTDALGSGNTQPEKFLNIDLGIPQPSVIFKNIGSFTVDGDPDETGDVFLNIRSRDPSSTPRLTWREDTTRKWEMHHYRAGNGRFRFINQDTGEDVFNVDPVTNAIDVLGNLFEGVDTTGAAPADTSTPAAWEEVEGDDGATYYRPLYQ